MLVGFKRRFAPMVKDKSKRHTIRTGDRYRPGQRLDCYVDPRQKTMALLGRWKCLKVEPIMICLRYNNRTTEIDCKIAIAGVDLTFDEAEQFAWADGFRHRIHSTGCTSHDGCDRANEAFCETLGFTSEAAGCLALFADYWAIEAVRRNLPMPFTEQLVYWE
jgi:hypothetical protein